MKKILNFPYQLLLDITLLAVSSIIIINYLFGYFLLADILCKYEVPTNIKFIGSGCLIFLNITNITCALFYVLYHKKLGINPKTWLLFGLVYGKLSVILLITSKINYKNTWSFFKSYKILLFVIISAYIVEQVFKIAVFKYTLEQFTESAQNIFHLMNSEVNAMKKVTFFLANIGISIWSFNLARVFKTKATIWVVIALLLGIISPIILNIYASIKKMK